jgi:hypothetical protein
MDDWDRAADAIDRIRYVVHFDLDENVSVFETSIRVLGY